MLNRNAAALFSSPGHLLTLTLDFSTFTDCSLVSRKWDSVAVVETLLQERAASVVARLLVRALWFMLLFNLKSRISSCCSMELKQYEGGSPGSLVEYICDQR